PHLGEDAPRERVLEHPEANRFFAQTAPKLMFGGGVQTFQVHDQERLASSQVRPELVHHQFFDVFTHGFGCCSCLAGSSSCAGTIRCMFDWPASTQFPTLPREGVVRPGFPSHAETRMPGLIVAETVIERIYVPLADAGRSVLR